MQKGSEKASKVRFDPQRRKFGKLAISSALGAKFLITPEVSSTDEKINTSNVKLAAMSGQNTRNDYHTYIKQLGLEYVVVWTLGDTSYDHLMDIRRTIEASGLKIANIGNGPTHNQDKITLNLPGRAEKIEEYKTFLRNAGRAGYHTSIYAHMASNSERLSSVWRTENEPTRGGALGSTFDLEKAKAGINVRWNLKVDRLTHGRVYTEQELWDNWEYFIKQVAPVAEEAGIRIGIHPDDPPGLTLGGVPRPIFSSFEGYRQALEIADSPNVGICLCVGCVLEAGKSWGRDVIQTIRYFGKRNKIFKVHFRNVNTTLPHFVEVFVDNGYEDMYKVMRALVEVNNHCSVIDDHVPQMVGGARVSHAFTIGYIKALLERANEEVKESDQLQWKGPYSS
ncbi:mannonate dehydratase [Candidatus Latescibacterota bacterium]